MDIKWHKTNPDNVFVMSRKCLFRKEGRNKKEEALPIHVEDISKLGVFYQRSQPSGFVN